MCCASFPSLSGDVPAIGKEHDLEEVSFGKDSPNPIGSEAVGIDQYFFGRVIIFNFRQ